MIIARKGFKKAFLVFANNGEHYCPRKSVNILAKLHILNGLTIV